MAWDERMTRPTNARQEDTRMAKAKKEYSAPETMGALEGQDGIEIVTVSRFLERAKKNKETGEIISGKDRPVTFKVATIQEGKMSGAGLKAVQSAVNAKHEGAGNLVLARAYNNEMIEAAFASLKDADANDQPAPDSLVLYPHFGKVRVTDEIEAAGDTVKALLASGAIKPEDLAALFAKATAK